MRRNPDQRTVDLRAAYRAEYGNDWWQDAEIKAQYDAEKRSIYRGDSKPSKKKSKSKGKGKRKSTKVTDMLDPKLRTAIDVAQTALEALFQTR